MTLFKYIIKKFLLAFLGALIFFSLLLVLVDLFMNLNRYLENNAPLKDVLKVMGLYFPKALWFSAPLAVLFGVAFTLSTLYASNELTVIFTSGISLFKLTFPLIVFSLVLSFGFFHFENHVVVPMLQKKVALQNKLLNIETNKNNSDVVIIANQGKMIYKANFYNDSAKELIGLCVIFRNDNKELDKILYTDYASWNENQWSISKGNLYIHENNNLLFTEDLSSISGLLTEPPDTFKNFEINVEEVDTKTAREYIALLQRTGLPSAEALSVYYKKYSFPFVIFLVVFLSIGLSCKSRKNVLLVSLILCVCAAVSFYVLQMITMNFAKFGYIPPIAGGWFPVVLFTLISIVLMKFAKT